MFWTIVFGAAAVALLVYGIWSRRTPGFPVLAVLTGLFVLSAWLEISLWVPFLAIVIVLGWFLVAARKRQGKPISGHVAVASFVTAALLATAVLTLANASTPESSNQTTWVSAKIGTAAVDQPLLSGMAAVTAEVPVTLECGKQPDGSYIPVGSWTELVACVEAAPEDQRAAFIAAANERKDLGLGWDDILSYAEAEKATGVESRVILVINSSATDEEVRAVAQAEVGPVAATLPIVRLDGYLVNSTDRHDGGIADIADGRSQIRLMLAPLKKDGEKFVPDLEKVAQGIGVLTLCQNFSSGIKATPPPVEEKPKPQPKPSTPGTVPPAESTTPVVSTTPGTTMTETTGTTATVTTGTTATETTGTTATVTTGTTATETTATTMTETTGTTATVTTGTTATETTGTTATVTTGTTATETTATTMTETVTTTPSTETTPTTETLQTKDPDDDISQSSVEPLPITGEPDTEDTQEDSPPEFTEQDPGDPVDIPAPDIDPEETSAAQPSESTSEEPVVTVTDGVPTDPADPGTEIVDPDDVTLSSMVASDNTAGSAALILLGGLVLLALGKNPVRFIMRVNRRRVGGAHR